jgi:hypothetical protein
MGFFHALWDWLAEYRYWIGAISAIMFFGTLVFLPVAVAYLPADYFTRRRRRLTQSPVGWLLLVA